MGIFSQDTELIHLMNKRDAMLNECVSSYVKLISQFWKISLTDPRILEKDLEKHRILVLILTSLLY